MYSLFRDLAIIILSAKFFGLLARKCKAPQVVGEIIAGLLIGPCLLNLVQISDSISIFAEIILAGRIIFYTNPKYRFRFIIIVIRIVIAVVLQLGLKSTDLKLLTALIVAISLSVPVFKSKIDKRRRAYKGPDNEVDTRHADDEFKHGTNTN